LFGVFAELAKRGCFVATRLFKRLDLRLHGFNVVFGERVCEVCEEFFGVSKCLFGLGLGFDNAFSFFVELFHVAGVLDLFLDVLVCKRVFVFDFDSHSPVSRVFDGVHVY